MERTRQKKKVSVRFSVCVSLASQERAESGKKKVRLFFFMKMVTLVCVSQFGSDQPQKKFHVCIQDTTQTTLTRFSYQRNNYPHVKTFCRGRTEESFECISLLIDWFFQLREIT